LSGTWGGRGRAPRAMAADSTAVRRLCADLARFQRQGNPQISVNPSSESMLEWHFALHDLPEDTVYKGGCYHGKLIFPDRYPFAPPSLVMLTPNGRLETNQRLCLSMTDFHPESWNPAWTVESILMGLISFMIDERDPVSYGAIHETAETRRRLASSSRSFNRSNAAFCELFPELVPDAPTSGDTAEPAGVPASASSAVVSPLVDSACSGQGASASAPACSPSALGGSSAGQEGLVVAEVGEEADPADAHGIAGDTSNARGEEEEPQECWICREDGTDEPLIQPCACRGSMSGVHASCVEAWISHHRANALGDEVPHCSVCNQPYCGTERRPGVAGFAQHLCSDCVKQAARSALLVALLVAYWTAAQPGLLELWIRIPLLMCSGVFFLYKAAVLSVSLPRGRLPPENCCRHFHTDDFRLVAMHIAETMAIILIAALWCIYGRLPYYYFIPLCSMVVLPVLSMLLRQQGSPCSYRRFVVLAMVLGSPLLLVVYLAKQLWSNPKRLVDLSDGLVHTFVSIAAIPLCWFCPSTTPVLILWGVHSTVLLLGLVDKGITHRVEWKEGKIWWIFMQLSILATYVANLLQNFSDGFLENDSSVLVFWVSFSWLALCCSLSFSVNWVLCVRHYHAWQHRNGSFTIGPSSSPVAAPPQMIGTSTEMTGDGIARADEVADV